MLVEPSVPNLPVVQISQPQNCSSSDSISDLKSDEEVVEGDAHTATIIGGPSPTMLYKENPAAVVNIAPCEGEKPIAILSAKKFEEMANPTKFPYGKGGFNIAHPKKLTPRKYFNQRLLEDLPVTLITFSLPSTPLRVNRFSMMPITTFGVKSLVEHLLQFRLGILI